MAQRRKPAADAPRPKLTGPQAAIYREGWKPGFPYRVACCGRRFGKSFLAVEEIRRAARLAQQNGIDTTDNQIWYAAPTFKSAKDNFWPKLKKGLPRRWMAKKPNESDCSITLLNQQVIRLVGLDNYDDRRGAGLWFIVLDECADVKFAAWDETIEPMLGTTGGNALFIGTPKGYNWFYDFHTKGIANQDGFLAFTYTTLQGGNFKPELVEKARREKDAKTFRQEYEATFESFSGRVVYAFSRAGNLRRCAYDENLPIDIGMDFNVNPMTATIWQNKNGEDEQVGEIIIPTSNTDEMCDEIKRRYGRNGSVSHITVYPDASGASRRTSAQGRTDIDILTQRGFNVTALSTNPKVRDRNNLVNARFCAADGTRTAFVDPTCVKSIEAYERHVYKEGTSEPDKSTGFDHPVDATGYRFWGRYAYKPAHTVQTTHMRR